MSDEIERKLRQNLGDRFDSALDEILARYANMIDRKAAMYILAIDEGIIKRESRELRTFNERPPQNSSVSFEGVVERVFVPFESKSHKTMRVLLGDDKGGELVLVAWDDLVDNLINKKLGKGDRLSVRGAYYRNGEAHAGGYTKVSITKKDRITALSQVTDGRCNVAVRLVSDINVREYVRNDEQKVMATGWVEDATGRVRFIAWGVAVDKISSAKQGDVLRIFSGLFKNGELHINDYSKVEINPDDCIVLTMVSNLREGVKAAYTSKIISVLMENSNLCCVTRSDDRDIKVVLLDSAKRNLIRGELSPDINLNTASFIKLKSFVGKDCIIEGILNSNGIFECSRIHLD